MFLRRFLSFVLCLVLSPVPALLAQSGSPQQAGQINALIPQGSRNDQLAKLKEEVDWNDLLKTQSAGRMRVGLLDGSMLSVGSNSQLRVVQHDNKSQQTSLELGFGKLRSKVVKITQPGGKYEVRTPHAVIGVIGTDFFLDVMQDRTRVICYTGTVSVTPLGASHVLNQQNAGNTAGAGSQGASASSAGSNALTLNAGQMVDVGPEIAAAVQPTPSEVQQASMSATNIGGEAAGIAAGSHTLLQTIVGIAVVGAVSGAVVGSTGQNGTPRFFGHPFLPQPPPRCPPTQCGTPRLP